MTQYSSSKHLLTSILTSLKAIEPPDPSTTIPPHISPLKQLVEPFQQEAKNILLTLHFLFPHELLPALDLIDRHLITHLYTTTSPVTSSSALDDRPLDSTDKPSIENEVYFVQSASSSSSSGSGSNVGDTGFSSVKRGRFRNALSKPGVFYEVRLDSWNCSCPAFAYSSMRLVMRDISMTGQALDKLRPTATGAADGKPDWLVGGIATKDDAVTPVCKHILAVALARAAPALFGAGVTAREVSKEEMAGWAAGWGEH